MRQRIDNKIGPCKKKEKPFKSTIEKLAKKPGFMIVEIHKKNVIQRHNIWNWEKI